MFPEGVGPDPLESTRANEKYGEEKELSEEFATTPRPRVLLERSNFSDLFLESIQGTGGWDSGYIGKYAVGVERKVGDKTLDYGVIDGEKIRDHIPEIWALRPKLLDWASNAWRGPIEFLHDKAALNINVVLAGGEQSWHQDRNPLTILCYLSNVEGGALQFELPNNEKGEVAVIANQVVILVCADQIKHRVKNVENGERITLVASFGMPGKSYIDPDRDDFLYSEDKPVPNQKVFDLD